MNWRCALEFVITASNGESVKVAAPNWMMAMGKAMDSFGMASEAMGRWEVSHGSQGKTHINDPVAGQWWSVVPIEQSLRVVARGGELDVPEPRAFQAQADDEPEEDKTVTDVEPPSIFMPETGLKPAGGSSAESSVEIFDSGNLAERLFELSMDWGPQQVDQSCRQALELLAELIPSEAGSVARGSVSDAAMTFVAATGTVSSAVVGRTMPFGVGILGLCFDMGIPMRVHNASEHDRHNAAFDDDTGFQTQAMLCVPIKNAEFGAVGVIQILNPSQPFNDGHVDAVEMVADALASTLAGV